MFCWGPAWKWVEGFCKGMATAEIRCTVKVLWNFALSRQFAHHFGRTTWKREQEEKGRVDTGEMTSMLSKATWVTPVLVVLGHISCIAVGSVLFGSSEFPVRGTSHFDAFFARRTRENDNDRVPEHRNAVIPAASHRRHFGASRSNGSSWSSRPNGASCSSGSASGSLPILPGSGGPCHLCQAWVYVHAPTDGTNGATDVSSCRWWK